MENNWVELWRELVIANDLSDNGRRALRYETHARKMAERPDPLLDFVLTQISLEETAIDIGAGGGRWTLPLARKARTVYAVEPSETMLGLLRRNISASGVNNIQIISTTWEEARVQPQDNVICSHAMYSSPDLAAFVRKMEDHALKRCYLEIRIPPVEGVLGELALAVYGRRHDSPNAIIAYNALYSLGIYANMMIEDTIYPWTDFSLEDAFTRVKRHLRLERSTAYDILIREVLHRRLSCHDGLYIWPDGMRSALFWWTPVRRR
jgi:SAM-dependent methyltransferase